MKNDIVTLTIDDIGTNGEGIGKVDGYTLFVKDAVVGDIVKAKIITTKQLKNQKIEWFLNVLLQNNAEAVKFNR